MNCLQFRRRLAAEPLSQAADMLHHREHCSRCATAWQRAQHFERDMLDALNVPVPEGLAERVLLAQATDVRQRQVRVRRRWLALAASLVLGTVAGGLLWHRQTRTLPQLAVAHMPGELDALALTQPLPQATIEQGFAVRGARLLTPAPGGTTYVHDCDVGPYRTVHLVTRRDGQPVVVLYLPGQHPDGSRRFQRDGWQGRALDLQHGTLVVLSDRAAPAAIDRVADAWQQAIDGPALARHTIRVGTIHAAP